MIKKKTGSVTLCILMRLVKVEPLKRQFRARRFVSQQSKSCCSLQKNLYYILFMFLNEVEQRKSYETY